MSRYSNLRDSIVYFAASAEEQFSHDLGADDAVNDAEYPLEHMLELGEITPEEAQIVRSLENLIDEYCASPGPKPWTDQSLLFSDPNWAEIRMLAVRTLAQLPDEERGNRQ